MNNDTLEREVAKLLEAWANMNTGSYNSEGIVKFAKEVGREYEGLADSVEYIPVNEGNLLALSCRKREEAPIKILFNGHLDTVYGLDSEFQRCEDLGDGKMRGPGVADMKGGLVIMLYTLKLFEQQCGPKNVGWEVLLNPDEEIGSPYSKELIKEAAKRNDLGLIFEPALPDGSLVRSRKGTAIYKLKVRGKAAHVGRDFKDGRNALSLLSEMCVAIEGLNKEIPGAIFNVGKIEGGGPVNVVPEVGYADLGVRYSDQEQEKKTREELEAMVREFSKREGFEVELVCERSRPAKPYSEGTEVLFEHIKECAKEEGIELDWKDTGGASDGNLFQYHGLTNIDNLGVRGNYIHSEQEYVELGSISERVKILVSFLSKLEKGDIQLDEKYFKNV